MTIRRIDRLCQLLNQQLLDGDLKPGDKLPSERQLAMRFETSRPLVREALQQLKGLGIIESRQGAAPMYARTTLNRPVHLCHLCSANVRIRCG